MRSDDPRRAVLVAMLVAGERPGALAAHFEVDANTIRAWRNDPDINAEVQNHRDAMLEEARKLGVGATDEAVRALVRNCNCGDPGVEVRAAAELLDRFGVPKTTKVETKVEEAPDIDGWIERQRERRAARMQGGQ